MLWNSSTCMKRFSNTVSVTTEVPSERSSSAIFCDCISVGKPGYGRVFRSTAFSGLSLMTRMPFSSGRMVTPISSILAITGPR
ncbi:hypothetical protein D3C71_1712420 [compost metagenome]